MTAEDPSCEVHDFNFDGIDDYFLKWSCGLCVFLALGLLAIFRHSFETIVFIVIWLGLWMTLIAGTYYALNNAEVFVNEDGIGRRLRGRRTQWIYWNDVALVREYSAYASAYKAKLRFVEVIPAKPSFLKFQLCSSMLISDRIERFDAKLIDVLNEYISKHAVKVEVKEDGTWRRRQRLASQNSSL